MEATLITVAYFVIGCGAAVAILIQRRVFGALSAPTHAVLMVALWPFLLPASLLAEPSVPPVSRGSGRGASATRIDRLALRAREIGIHASIGESSGREQAAVEAFVERLRICDQRVIEMDRALEEAPQGVRAKLEGIRRDTLAELEEGLEVLEELVGQLLVLRFTELHPPSRSGSERQSVEALLLKIEALSDLGSSSGPARAQ